MSEIKWYLKCTDDNCDGNLVFDRCIEDLDLIVDRCDKCGKEVEFARFKRDE